MRIKKLLALLLSATMALGLLAGCGGGGGTDDGALGYTYDDETNTYYVSSAEGLETFAKAVLKDTSTNCTLINDIDLTGIDWAPIGSNGNDFFPYLGTFDGGSYTITGLTVSPNYARSGLFGVVGAPSGPDGIVKNLTLSNATVNGGSSGAVAGMVYETGTIENCTVMDSSIKGGNAAGNIVGENRGTVTGCGTSASTATGPQGATGVLIGIDHTSSTDTEG